MSRTWQSGKLLAPGKPHRCIVAIIACNALQRCNEMQRSAIIARGVCAKSATMQRLPCVLAGRFGRTWTPRAKTWAKAPRNGVFPESFATVGQLSDMARMGYPCEICLTSALFWPWANSPPWPKAFLVPRYWEISLNDRPTSKMKWDDHRREVRYTFPAWLNRSATLSQLTTFHQAFT